MPKRKKDVVTIESSKSDKDRTQLSDHVQVGKKLFPPLAPERLEKMGDVKTTPSSWMNERLPEMLWAELIIAATDDRDYALVQFRRILNFIGNHDEKDQFHDLTLTGIAKLEKELRTELIQFIVEPPEVSHALCTLRLFDALPGREEWDQALPSFDPSVELLMHAVGRTLWHQSQESTDCRWFRVMTNVISGKLVIMQDLDLAEELFKYPHHGSPGAVQASVRATELAMPAEQDFAWSNAFWEEAWENTPCIVLTQRNKPFSIDENNITRQNISDLCEHLKKHWRETHSTTAIDPKHDAIFGMAFYSLRILEEMMGIGIGTGVIARLALRTILETRINLKYLLTKDVPELWKKWRVYGAGQAKLNILKFDDSIEPPRYINVESIEYIANEDIWEEFLTVNLAGWSGLDLRKLSEQSELKDIYDKHYSWTSGYSHGMWGAIRESCYQTCGNPLHRLHRHPQRQSLKDTVDDAAIIVDEVIQHVDDTYPTFAFRLLGQ